MSTARFKESHMDDEYSIQFVCKSRDGDVTKVIPIASSTVKDVSSILDLGLRHSEQIELLKNIQDQILKLQAPKISATVEFCPKCKSKMKRNGYTQSEFNSVFTDHKVPMTKQRCTNKNCDGSLVPSIRSTFGTTMHPDLAKLQCEIGSEHTYREAQNILNKKSSWVRKVNNHERVHHVVESVGQYISDTATLEPAPPVDVAPELIMQVDGGHLKDKDPEKRSFEALTAVIYRPGSILHSIKAKDHRGEILNKHCSASALNDNQQYMKASTLLAARKQGLDKSTQVTALCDGAANCWNIVDSIESHCAAITRILDWFHIAMKFKNVAIPDDFKEDYHGAKWSLWHGKPDEALKKLKAIKQEVNREKTSVKLEKMMTYIDNNKDYIVCYEDRKNKGLTFTSHLAESTVESLINKRCKGRQHMRWTREGVHPLLQIRCYVASNEWNENWQRKVLGAMTKAA